MNSKRILHPQIVITARYGITIETLLSITTKPYTPAQRTTLVTDYLNWWQEGHPDASAAEFEQRRTELTTASDEALNRYRYGVDEWILSQQRVPGPETDDIVASIREYVKTTELPQRFQPMSVGEIICQHQLFKRFANTGAITPETQIPEPDYGFLSGQTYRHKSDQ